MLFSLICQNVLLCTYNLVLECYICDAVILSLLVLNKFNYLPINHLKVGKWLFVMLSFLAIQIN